MDHKKSTEKLVKAIKWSPVIKALQLTVLFVGNVIQQQNQPHTSSVSVALAEFRCSHLGKHFYGTKRL
jgi:hypothetical protein